MTPHSPCPSRRDGHLHVPFHLLLVSMDNNTQYTVLFLLFLSVTQTLHYLLRILRAWVYRNRHTLLPPILPRTSTMCRPSSETSGVNFRAPKICIQPRPFLGLLPKRHSVTDA